MPRSRGEVTAQVRPASASRNEAHHRVINAPVKLGNSPCSRQPEGCAGVGQHGSGRVLLPVAGRSNRSPRAEMIQPMGAGSTHHEAQIPALSDALPSPSLNDPVPRTPDRRVIRKCSRSLAHDCQPRSFDQRRQGLHRASATNDKRGLGCLAPNAGERSRAGDIREDGSSNFETRNMGPQVRARPCCRGIGRLGAGSWGPSAHSRRRNFF